MTSLSEPHVEELYVRNPYTHVPKKIKEKIMSISWVKTFIKEVGEGIMLLVVLVCPSPVHC